MRLNPPAFPLLDETSFLRGDNRKAGISISTFQVEPSDQAGRCTKANQLLTNFPVRKERKKAASAAMMRSRSFSILAFSTGKV
jgi:hypothetical protein